jgi:TolB protein
MKSSALLLGLVLALSVAVGRADAQERDSIPGVTLGLVYETAYTPALAVRPFLGRFGAEGAAGGIEAIIARDLRNSDRFQVMDSIPAALAGESVDYALWDRLGAVWLLTGQVEAAGGRFTLVLELHDVVYKRTKESARFDLPNPDDGGFRMAVHRASDQVVRWVTGEPGMAASRIAFSMPAPGTGNKEMYVIDSDGENLTRVTDHGGPSASAGTRTSTLSPTWSPDGTKLAFSSTKSGVWRIYIRDLRTRSERMLTPLQSGDHITPEWAPDGVTLAFAVVSGERSGIFTYNVERSCCLTHLSGGRWNDLSPVYSPDGDVLAFNSNRIAGTAAPQIYTMPGRGGEPDLVSPYDFDRPGYFSAPDWSPVGGLVAFHGAIRRGFYHILVVRPEDRGGRVRQLTWEGNNEDPSWAPDGRHLVFKGERNWGKGLFAVDVATGSIRAILTGVDVDTPEWSPALAGP